MTLRIYRPPPALQWAVGAVIYYRGYSAPHPGELLLPDGNAQLVIELDGNERTVGYGTPAERSLRGAWITGVQTGPLVYRGERDATTVCIQFSPGGLYRLLGVPSAEFRDRVVDASLLAPLRVLELREQLLAAAEVDAADTDAVAAVVWRFLHCSLQANDTPGAALAFAVQRLHRPDGSIGEISRLSGYSHKHLIELFKTHVGVAPKAYQRVLRFNRALAALGAGRFGMADLAQRCGYSDQAHFGHEFRRLSGYTPGSYLSANREYRHVIGIDR